MMVLAPNVGFQMSRIRDAALVSKLEVGTVYNTCMYSRTFCMVADWMTVGELRSDLSRLTCRRCPVHCAGVE